LKRPDGRAVPSGGYRAEDMVDDDIEAASDNLNPSAEGFARSPVEGIAQPSAEGLPVGRRKTPLTFLPTMAAERCESKPP
jgi:hypothetical protein